LLTCAKKTVVPAGDALAVDRDAFGQLVTYEIERNPNILKQIRDEEW
jgi:folate-dependent tRNA-U54 methylase TrmFO/GidA